MQEAIGAAVRYFVFPYDLCGPAALTRLRQQGYLGARCGPRGISEPGFPDSLPTRFDVWGPNFSIYGESGPCEGLVTPDANIPPGNLPQACRRFVLNQYVNDAIAENGWAIRTLAGFEGDPNPFQPIDVDDYTAHLDFVKNRVDAGQLWVDGPTAIVKYRWARERCPRPTFEGNAMVFSAPTPGCLPYATTLSYVVTIRDDDPLPSSLTVTQAGVTYPARPLAVGRYLVDARSEQGQRDPRSLVRRRGPDAVGLRNERKSNPD